MKYTTESVLETKQIAKEFVTSLEQSDAATVIGLYGDLGAGKTTFTQGVAQSLGIPDTVVSPTFVIEKIYELPFGKVFSHLIHIDAYRIEHSDEMIRLGWRKIISDPANLIIVEWPENIADIMPTHHSIHFTHATEFAREIEIQA